MRFLVVALCLAPLFAQPEIPFVATSPLQLPDGFNLGEVSGFALNSKGHMFVYNRGAKTQLFEFDASGKMLREIGKDLYGFSFAHVVKIDKDDNIWCVDEGANTIIEFNPQGHVIMVLGRKAEPSEAPPAPGVVRPARDGLFNRPTDIAWDAAGNGYISDGYNNSRVGKIDKDGNWLKSWGKRGADPGDFHTPHSIATDAKGNVYVGDRENNRIQVFNGEGEFLKQWTNVGSPWAICITPGPNQVLFSSDSRPGRIFKMDLNGNVLGVFGKAGKRSGQFGWIHQMACPNENTLYVAELLNWRVQKLTLK